MGALLGRLLAVALAAGLLAGLAVSVVQHVTTTPLILAAEIHEAAGGPAAAHGRAHSDPAGPADDGGAWAPRDGLERTLYTGVANVVLGVGFALLLVAAFALSGGAVDARRGAVWGAAGFAAFVLGPGLGLPPEVPGAMAADLAARQLWWLTAAAATAVGLALLAFGRRPALVALGVLALVLPHAVGAPHPPAAAEAGGAAALPPELAARFVAASFVTAAVFWALLGAVSGALYRRLVA